MFDEIIVLDFGSQYNQLIARRIREMGVYSELVSNEITAEQIKNRPYNIKGIIFSGSPNSVYEEGSFKCDKEIFNLGLPILGICYGLHLMCYQLGGKIEGSDKKEYGGQTIDCDTNSKLFAGLSNKEDVWMSHGDKVVEIPEGFKVIAKTNTCPYAAIENVEKNFYAVQFHPEVRNSVHGLDMINNFVFKVCGAQANWKMENYIEEQVKKIRETVGDKRVLCGLSGGVDSSVTAVLIHKAIGNQLTCMFVDNGLLRKNEGDEVMDVFTKTFHMDIRRINAGDRFLEKLKGVSEPEKKRKIIGSEFIYVFDDESKKLGEFDFLAQGTLYTDVIESGTKTAQTIKSHHNVGGLPKDMKFKLIEPLNRLFKDEARALGEALGIPHDLVWRQPFPGPGLGIRVLGEITEEKLEIVRESDAILREEIKNAGLQEKIWQYFTILPNMKSVGVMGDQRTYSYCVIVRGVTSIDGMTGDWAKIPYEVLDKISRRIVNEVKGVNRVAYDITSKPPATIEWE